MSRIKKAMPSPAMLVAIVALVAALGGSAVAEVASTSLSKGDKKQTKKIAKQQAKKQIKKKESGLNVNSAKTATDATNATNATSVSGRTPFLIKLAAGQTQTIATNGAVSLEANCNVSGGDDGARVLGQTTQNGASLEGEDSFNSGNFDTGTAAGAREVLLQPPVTSGTTNVEHSIDAGFVMAPDGKTLGIDGESTALGVNYAGAKCVLSGVVNASG